MTLTPISGPARRSLALGAADSLQVFGQAPQAAAGPWWLAGGAACVWAAYQPKGAANQAASYLDLSGNGNNAGVGVAPTWDAVNGWKFNGINQYLTTTFVQQLDQSQTMIARFTNASSLPCHIAGAYSVANSVFLLSPRNAADTLVYYYNGGAVGISVAPSLAAGNLCVAGSQGYRNGIAEGGAIAAGGANPIAVYIGCYNRFGAAFSFSAIYIQALALYDCTLTAPQVLAIATAMSAL